MTDGKEYRLICGDSCTCLKDIPDESVDCCVTSPPYYALRDYGTGHWIGGDAQCQHERGKGSVCRFCGAEYEDAQIGLENRPEEYVQNLVSVFREVRRVLKNDGTLWINIADSYWGSGSRGTDFTNKPYYENTKQDTTKCTHTMQNVPRLVGNEAGIKNKDLIGIPWMLAFALRNDGWYLRQEVIWAKPNPMPESVTDRCTKSHESIFLLTKRPKYYFDYASIQEEAISDPKRYDYPIFAGKGEQEGIVRPKQNANTAGIKKWTGKRNKRDVWFINTKAGYKDDEGAHYATFPTQLIEPCISAGCKPGGWLSTLLTEQVLPESLRYLLAESTSELILAKST